MSQAREPKNPGRDQRSSAGWGKRLSMLLLFSVAQAGFVFAQNSEPSKFAPDLSPALERAHQGVSANETVKVIVQYGHVPKSDEETKVKRLGAQLNHRLGLVKGMALTIPVSALPALEADSEVMSVSLDHPLRASDDISDAATNVPSAWNAGLNGAGIGVAVIDSGINDSHPDLQNWNGNRSRVVYHQDFTGTPTSNSSGAQYDLYGHGTHVAGIIGGNGSMSSGNYIGVAPAVTLIDLRALDANGGGTDSAVIAAIQEAIALQNKYNIQVINLSLGRGIAVGYAQDALCQAVESAWKAGIVVVVASGNYGRLSIAGSNGYGTVTAPGNDPFVITVGAMNSDGSSAQASEIMTSYTSKGPTTYDHVVKPDIMAPGNGIVSLVAPGATLEAEYPAQLVDGNNGQPDYFTLSGTSMATPVVSGAVALLIQQNGNLTPDQVKARLMQSTYANFSGSTVASVPSLNQTFTEYYDLFSVGSGLLNMQAALSDNSLAPGNVGAALSPSAVYNPSNGTVSLVNGNNSVPARAVVWGTSSAWSFASTWSDVTGNSVVWNTQLPWNDNQLIAFSVVWGSSTGAADDMSVVWGAAILGFDFGDAASPDGGPIPTCPEKNTKCSANGK